MSMTPEEFLAKENAVRELAGTMGFLYELVRDFRRGFVETAEMGGETADLLAAQLFQTLILPLIVKGFSAPDADEVKLRAAAHRALDVLRISQRLDMTVAPVTASELRDAVELLEDALDLGGGS